MTSGGSATGEPDPSARPAVLDGEAKDSFGAVVPSTGLRATICAVIAVVWLVVQIYMSIEPTAVPATPQRAIHLGFGLLLAATVLAAHARTGRAAATWYLLGAAGVVVEWYAFREIVFQVSVGGLYRFPDTVVAVAGLLVLAVLTSRVIGWVLPVLGAVFLMIPLIGPYLPGSLRMAAASPERLVNAVYFGNEGVHGVPLDASNRYIFVFVVFGTFLAQFGASDFIVRSVTGFLAGARGGAGKMSVTASALFGITSDSSTANVTTTGIVMIPLMKRSGFSAERAAGIESAGAIGGLMVPPVLGAVAFIMVGITGIPLHEVVLAAIIPAVLYYYLLYLGVDRLAARDGIGGVSTTQPPVSRRHTVLDVIEFVTPMACLLVLLLVVRWEPSEAAGWSLLLLVVLHLLRHRSRAAVRDCLTAAVVGPQRAVVVTIITASVGVLVGPVLISGLGLDLAGGLLAIGSADVVLLLVVTMLASVVLGSGLPASATYVFLAVLFAPSLAEFGIPLLAAHMFIMYLGNVADLSPPTMATVYVASGIARSRPMRSSAYAMLFGVGGVVVPLMFVFRPELLLIDATWWRVLLSLVVAVGGLTLIVVAGVGQGRARLSTVHRVLVLACGLATAVPLDQVAIPALVVGVVLVRILPASTRTADRGPETEKELIQ